MIVPQKRGRKTHRQQSLRKRFQHIRGKIRPALRLPRIKQVLDPKAKLPQINKVQNRLLELPKPNLRKHPNQIPQEEKQD